MSSALRITPTVARGERGWVWALGAPPSVLTLPGGQNKLSHLCLTVPNPARWEAQHAVPSVPC
jgi:hypothetical protein